MARPQRIDEISEQLFAMQDPNYRREFFDQALEGFGLDRRYFLHLCVTREMVRMVSEIAFFTQEERDPESPYLDAAMRLILPLLGTLEGVNDAFNNLYFLERFNAQYKETVQLIKAASCCVLVTAQEGQEYYLFAHIAEDFMNSERTDWDNFLNETRPRVVENCRYDENNGHLVTERCDNWFNSVHLPNPVVNQPINGLLQMQNLNQQNQH